MLESFINRFFSNSFSVQGQGYLWKPQLVWLHLASDSLIGLADFLIPILLIYFVHKRRDLPFRGIFLMFGALLISCGTSHLLEVWTLWYPNYWLLGSIKLITALVSLYTTMALFAIIPQAIALPSSAQIDATNQKLAQEIQASETAIKQRTLAEAALKESETRFRLIFENAAVGIALSSISGELMVMNPTFQQMLGYSQNELTGIHFREVTHPDFIPTEAALRQEMVEGRRNFYQLEKIYINKERQPVWGHLTVSLVRDAEEQPQFCIAMVENITERKQAETALRHYQEHLEELVGERTAELTRVNEQLSWQASHDALTELVNRREFEKCLEKAVSSSRMSEQDCTLCYMDLDHFKIVNDTCGHLVGDELLRQVSRLLQSRCRKTDTLARLGGDEFGLLLYQCSLDEARRVVQALHQSIQDFRFVWEDKTFTLGISIGLASINQCRLNSSNILNAADAACYAAKKRGRNQVYIYQVDERELQEQSLEFQ